jgi:putative hydrolase of the HAD superfamily
MAVRNLIMDMGNVLLTWEPRAFALRAAGNRKDAEILYSALFDSVEWHLHDAGQIDEEELLRVSLSRTPQRLHDTIKVLHEQWPRWMAPIPGADAFTIKVREAGLRLYLLSNAGTRFPEALKERDFYPRLHGAMVSAHEKLTKPDRRVYERLCERFSLLPRECLFVDDLIENVDGAMKAGMAAHLFDGDFIKVEDRLRGLGVALP